MIIWRAFFVAGARAFCPVLKALNLPEDRKTLIVLIQTCILTYLIETSATRIGACQFLMHTLLLSLDWRTCIVFKLTIVKALLAFLGKRRGH